MLIPPVPIPAGQSVVWSFATTAVPFVGNPISGSAIATLTTCQITQISSGPLTNTNYHVTWGGFTTPNEVTRPGCNVFAIYPVFIAQIVDQYTVTGLNLLGTNISGAPWNGAGGNVTQTWYTNAGTDLAVLNHTILTSMSQTTGPFVFPAADSILATFVGVAIYITAVPEPSVFIGINNDTYTNVGNS